MKETTDIILLRYNCPELENECIKQVLKCTNVPYNLYVYDNYPGGGVAEGWNKVIKGSDGKYICLLNTDTIVEDGWLEKLLENFKEDVGAVGPITNKCGTHQTGFSKEDRLDNQSICNTLSGFCLVFRRELWNEEKFNEDYRMYAEETEFLDHARKRGWKLITDYRVHIFHYGGQSAKKAQENGEDIQTIKKASQELYNKRKYERN